MSHEGTKSLRRRWIEDFTGEIPWRRYISGKILDVGAGPDKLKLPDVTSFDSDEQADVRGDANKLSEYFPANSFDCVHGSQILEHVLNPTEAIRDWMKIVKPGQYIVCSVPDIGAYERFQFPSKFNSDHKSSFSIIYKGSSFPIHIYLPDFLKSLEDVAITILCRYVEKNMDWKVIDRDLTWREEDGCEIWNEFVLQKLPI